MDIEVTMYFWDENTSGRVDSFPLIAFYPGKMQKSVKSGKYWSKFLENKTVLPIDNYMELAYKLNNLVIYKETDLATQKMIEAQIKQQRFDGKIDVYIKNQNTSRLWQGSYNFDFKVEKVLGNNVDDEGHKWDIALLKIIDKTETKTFPTG